MKLTTTQFKTTDFGKAVAFARSTSPVTLTTRNQEDLVLIKKSDLDKLGDAHKQLEIE